MSFGTDGKATGRRARGADPQGPRGSGADAAARSEGQCRCRVPRPRPDHRREGRRRKLAHGHRRDARVTKGDVVAAPAATRRHETRRLPSRSAGSDRTEQRDADVAPARRIAEPPVRNQSPRRSSPPSTRSTWRHVIELRNRYKDKFEKEHGVKLGFMSFFVKAVTALKRYPLVNASIDGNDIVYHGYYDIGIAVGSPRGLVVPILRNADQMSLADIEREDRRLRQARAGRQAHDRGADRRHVLDLQRRRVRLDAVDADHQPAAERDPGRARDQGARGGRTARSSSAR